MNRNDQFQVPEGLIAANPGRTFLEGNQIGHPGGARSGEVSRDSLPRNWQRAGADTRLWQVIVDPALELHPSWGYSTSCDTTRGLSDLWSKQIVIAFCHGQAAPGWTQKLEKILVELGRLRSDWAGPGSVAPSKEVIEDIQRTGGYLPGDTRAPDVEVDEDDGSVTFRWWDEAEATSFALVFNGSRHVIGILSGSERTYEPWKLGVGEEARLSGKFADEAIREIIAARHA